MYLKIYKNISWGQINGRVLFIISDEESIVKWNINKKYNFNLERSSKFSNLHQLYTQNTNSRIPRAIQLSYLVLVHTLCILWLYSPKILSRGYIMYHALSLIKNTPSNLHIRKFLEFFLVLIIKIKS